MGIICNNEKNKLDEGLANLEVFKQEEYVPFAVATLRAMYQEWAKNHPDKAKPEPNEESSSEMLAYAKELLGYKNALVRARSKEIGKASTNSASAYHSLTKAYGNATTIRQRASAIAYMFTEEAEKIRDEYNSKNTKQITTLDVIQGFKDSRGKPWAGELQVFQRVYDRLMKEYLFTSDPHKKEEYKKMIDNWGAFGMLSRVILRRTEGVKLGAFNDYALRAELEEAEGIMEAYEDLDIEESHKESWMEHKDRVSGFASLGLEVRSIISKIPAESRAGNSWVEEKDDLGFPIMVDPMYAHNALANLFRGMTDSNRMMDLLRIEASKENHVFDYESEVKFTPNIYKVVLAAIEKDPTLKTKFFTNYKKGFTPYVQISMERDKGKIKFRTASLNRTYSTGESAYIARLFKGYNFHHPTIFNDLGQGSLTIDSSLLTREEQINNIEDIKDNWTRTRELLQAKDLSNPWFKSQWFKTNRKWLFSILEFTKNGIEFKEGTTSTSIDTIIQDRIEYLNSQIKSLQEDDSKYKDVFDLGLSLLLGQDYTKEGAWQDRKSSYISLMNKKIKKAAKEVSKDNGKELESLYSNISRSARVFGIIVTSEQLDNMRKQNTLSKFIGSLLDVYNPHYRKSGGLLTYKTDANDNPISFADVYLNKENDEAVGFRGKIKNIHRYIDDADASIYERRARIMDSKGKPTTVFSDQNPCFFTDTIDTIMSFSKTGDIEGLHKYTIAKYLGSNYFYEGGIKPGQKLEKDKIRNVWLREWLFNPEALDMLEHHRFAQMQIEGQTLSFENLSSKQHMLALLQNYLFAGSTMADRKYAYYPLFILGDSGVARFIKAPKYSTEKIVEYYVELYEQEKAMQREMTAVDQALKAGKVSNSNKIGTQPVVYKDGLKPANKYEFKSFQFVKEYINSLSKEEQEQQNLTSIESLSEMTPEQIKKVIEKALSSKKEKFKEKLKTLGVLEPTITRKDGTTFTTYRNLGILNHFGGKSKVEVTDENIDAIIEDFYYNYSFAMSQQLQLMTISPNYYKSIEELQKRYKEIHASGTPLDIHATYVKNGQKFSVFNGRPTERAAYFDDILVDSSLNNPDFYKAAKGATTAYDKYLENTLTDGQSFRTIDSYRKIAIAQGLWNVNGKEERLYDMVIALRKNAKQGIQPTKAQMKKISELAVVLQPQKPYLFTFEKFQYTADNIEGIQEALIPVQHKCAEVVLIPELLPNHSPLKHIADAMVDNNIDVLCSTEVVKVGGFGATEIGYATNEEGLYVNSYGEVLSGEDGGMPKDRADQRKNKQFGKRLDTDDRPDRNMPVNLVSSAKANGISLKEAFTQALSKAYIHELSLETYYRQQNVPEHIYDSRGVGTQLRKVFFDRLTMAGNGYEKYLHKVKDENGNETQPTQVNIGGTLYDISDDGGNGGRNLARFYNSLIVANIMESFDSLAKEVSNSPSLSRALQQMVINSSDSSYFALLNYAITGDGQFLTPLYESCIEHDTSSKLISLFKKKVQKQKMCGGSAVQATAFGITDVMKDSHTADDGGLGYKIEETYDKKGNKIKNILYMECEMPWDLRYTDALGNEVLLEYDYYCYTKEDELAGIGKEGELRPDPENSEGTLLEKEFPGILDLIAYRIPTERAYSMMNLKIKRFSRKESGGVIKVPAEGTTIAGFDFK